MKQLASFPIVPAVRRLAPELRRRAKAGTELALARARYHALHESIRLPLVGAHRLAFALAGQRRSTRDTRLERAVRQRYFELLQRDFDNARRGLYPLELLFDFPLRAYARKLPRLVLDMPNMARRRNRGNYRDLPPEVELERYPAYYRRTFHWQTDGYFSRGSAELYDLGVEFLFVGCGDVMRRQALAEVMRQRPQGALRLLDVGAGTGRFLEQASRCLPGCELWGLELSPWYKSHAEGRFHERAQLAKLEMVLGNAEAMPFPDAHFEVVTSIFLFHELPKNARRRVLAEMRRVLAPGGLLVIQDAAQPSDSPELSPILHQFSRDLHEPFFEDYLRDDLESLLEECGFTVRSSAAHFVSKVVSARRPSAAGERERRRDVN